MSARLKKLLYLAVATGLGVFSLSSLILPGVASAGVLEPRSLTLQAGATAGGSDPGGTVNNLFQFTIPSTDTSTAIQSMSFQYCEEADSTCGNLNTDYAMSTTGATIGAATSSFLSTFTLATPATQLEPIISSTTAFTPGTNDVVTVQLDGIVNPNVANYSFYVRITTWTGTDGSGTAVSTGNVAAATANPIQLSGQMPESLVFCTGATVGETSGVPDCTTATAGSVSFTTLFSPNYTSTATSQMAASTNAGSGYAITVNGNTLQSGSYSITAIGATAASPVHGTDQFGMNLMANTTLTATPAPGAAVTPASDGVNYFALPTTAYGTVDEYAFSSGNTVATSGYSTGTPTVGSDAQIYTTTYIVDVQGRQQAGTYTTTLTYICTPTF